MVKYNFRGSFDHCSVTCMGSFLRDGKILVSDLHGFFFEGWQNFWLVNGNQSEKAFILKTISRQNRLFL